MSKRGNRFLAIIGSMLILAAVLLAKPAFHLLKTLSEDTTDPAQMPAGTINDASRLNQTEIAEVWEVPVHSDNFEGQLANLLLRARAEGLRVSIAGARHSMGGHTFYPGGIVVNMLRWNRMELDTSENILRVQAGALWKDVIEYLDPLGRSVWVMQSINSFSVGGSISMNRHGWQYNRPPIASTVDAAIQHDGSYYLTYRLHATVEQFNRAYPQGHDFFLKKREYDPMELFQNHFYLKYAMTDN